MENANPSESLRDTISASLDAVENPTPPVVETPPVEPVKTETEEDKQGRTANRLRDDQGRLLPGKKEAIVVPQVVAPVVTAVPVVPIQRPTSWKKDYWEKFDKIATEDPELAKYIHQREQEYSSGVSTYKSEAENARQLNEAIAPFLPTLQQHKIEPTQWIRNLGTAHERLALGSPQEKVAMGVQLIREYGIDPQALFQAITNPQYQPPVQQQPAYNPQQIDQTVQSKVEELMMKRDLQSAFEKFVNAKDDTGNSKYPYYEQVKETMAGLLRAELAQDYESAYEAALRHPRHGDIFNTLQEQQRQKDETERLARAKADVSRARSQTVSVKSSTPSGPASTQGKPGLRDQLSDAFDSIATGRV